MGANCKVVSENVWLYIGVKWVPTAELYQKLCGYTGFNGCQLLSSIRNCVVI